MEIHAAVQALIQLDITQAKAFAATERSIMGILVAVRAQTKSASIQV